MLVPVSRTEMPFRLVVLHEDDRGSHTTTLPLDMMLLLLDRDGAGCFRSGAGRLN